MAVATGSGKAAGHFYFIVTCRCDADEADELARRSVSYDLHDEREGFHTDSRYIARSGR